MTFESIADIYNFFLLASCFSDDSFQTGKSMSALRIKNRSFWDTQLLFLSGGGISFVYRFMKLSTHYTEILNSQRQITHVFYVIRQFKADTRVENSK